MRAENGFTIIELVTVIGIISVLAALGITAFKVYKTNAAYANAESTLVYARRVLEGSLNDVDAALPAVPITTQTVRGPIIDPTAATLLPELRLPKQTQFTVFFDPNCADGACTAEILEARHCLGDKHVRWFRMGDGSEFLWENNSGGCI